MESVDAIILESTRVRALPRRVARAAVVILFWGVAALLVLEAHRHLDTRSAVAGASVKIAAIVVTAWAYMRLTAREVTLDHALAVGVAWLFFDIVAELTTAAIIKHGWYELMGSPAIGWLRNLLMLTWLSAPALFARRHE